MERFESRWAAPWNRLRSLSATCCNQARIMIAGPVTRRLLYTIVLLPIVLATSILGTVSILTASNIALDEVRLFHGLFAGLWVILFLFLWRSFILWTFGRKILNILLIGVPFAQVLYPHPLWKSSGCLGGITDVFLRHGQHHIGVGVYVWLAIWVWWGGERVLMTETVKTRLPRAPVSKTARRLIASVGYLPFVLGCFLLVGIALEQFVGLKLGSSSGRALDLCITAIVAAGVWLLIWRKLVVWSPKVLWATLASIVLVLGIPSAATALSSDSNWKMLDYILVFTPLLCWGLWMAGTVTLWPMRADDIAPHWLTPRCRNCGYLLSGLRATRCPECGDEPTLDELWLSTAGEVL